ncbi:transketolase [Pseudonocardia sp.]|uniref:transketolase n=1 Tax=Pseudonocardia sp. TaxID=60912 RepID=UPI00262C01A3|nr:transketolase [Pseudonocardia sp.]
MTATPTAPTAVVADLAPAPDDVDGRAVATIRMLAADAVQAANSGHPGLPLGAAVPAWAIFSRFLRHDPGDPGWPDRDRFVLSAGHGSALLYALLHLTGYDLPAAELARFRQWGSRTPGHPEHGHTPGVETTTGPLGQGLANAVGMALAERMLAARCNADGPVVDHRTWVLAGDGDLMEGISHEAASLAGHLGLGRLIVVFDDNDVTIDGAASRSCSDNPLARFAAYGWHTARVGDGNDLDAVCAALQDAAEETARPSLVAVRTVIGFGSPVAGTPKAHGSPLGVAGVAELRARHGWPDEPFHVPSDVAAHCAEIAGRGRRTRLDWADAHADGWRRWSDAAGRTAFDPPDFDAATATRVASGATLRAAADACPGLVGGSADLEGSTGTALPGHGVVTRHDFSGRTVAFGIREHGMAAVLNGIALHGGLRPFGSTFLVFSDYLRPALRLSALMGLPVVHVFTHDSVVVGEDGPTHQPVEHVEALRLIPGLAVLRPADAHETAACWATALARTDGPTALVLTRQDLPVLDPVPAAVVAEHGARTVREPARPAQVVLVATGSEVSLALSAADRLDELDGPAARVVSVPWRERAVGSGRLHELLGELPAVWVEAGSPVGWRAVSRPGDAVIGLERFGASAPGPEVYARLGFTSGHLVDAAVRVTRVTDPTIDT